MRQFRTFFSLFSLFAIALCALERWVSAAFRWMAAPFVERPAADLPVAVEIVRPAPLASALLNWLRHEAGVPRRAAARNI